MANNKSIQILRGTNANIVASDETLLPGQPLYNLTKGYLTIGGGGANGDENSPLTSKPIGVRELVGYLGDYNGITDSTQEVASIRISDMQASMGGASVDSSSLQMCSAGYLSLSANGPMVISAKHNGQNASPLTIQSANMMNITCSGGLNMRSYLSSKLIAVNTTSFACTAFDATPTQLNIYAGTGAGSGLVTNAFIRLSSSTIDIGRYGTPEMSISSTSFRISPSASILQLNAPTVQIGNLSTSSDTSGFILTDGVSNKLFQVAGNSSMSYGRATATVYGAGSSFISLVPTSMGTYIEHNNGDGFGNKRLTLPSKAGTLALTSNIPKLYKINLFKSPEIRCNILATRSFSTFTDFLTYYANTSDAGANSNRLVFLGGCYFSGANTYPITDAYTRVNSGIPEFCIQYQRSYGSTVNTVTYRTDSNLNTMSYIISSALLQ